METIAASSDFVIYLLVLVVVSVVVSARETGTLWAILLVVVKFAIPVVYCTYFFRLEWVPPDAYGYFERGLELYAEGATPWGMFLDVDYNERLRLAANSAHILYYWFSASAFYLGGPYYASPIVINVTLTFFVASMLGSLVTYVGFSKTYRKALFIFAVLHPELVSWSSLVSLKDTLVMFLEIGMVWSLFRIKLGKNIAFSIVTAAICCSLLANVRFYMPMFIVGGFIMGHLRELSWRNALVVMVGVVAVNLTVLKLMQFTAIYEVGRSSLSGLASLPYGVIKFMLTPRPWAIDEIYSYLYLAAWTNLLWLLPMVVGAWHLYRTGNSLCRFVVMILLLTVVFYSLFEDQRGPRYRVQFLYATAWCQFHGMLLLWRGNRSAGGLQRSEGTTVG